jgi:hypothetical protein
MAAPQHKITAPHAAVIVWNYDDKGGLQPFTPTSVNDVKQKIISTLSCISITTEKTKSNPQGSFRLILSPYKDWISTITPGSWCVLLMSQKPITADDLNRADPDKVKMIGKIDSVRVDTSIDDTGTRRTQYIVTGIDWGYIFNNSIYVDNYLSASGEPKTQGQGVATAMQHMLFGKDGVPKSDTVPSLLRSLIGLFGQPIRGFTEQGKDINRLANAVYNFLIPQQMVTYFNFIGPNEETSESQKLNEILTLKTGSLTSSDTYNGEAEAVGFIDPYSLQGQHTFWQVLQDNSNPALNEMLCDLRWENGGLKLVLYNRIKPFSFSDFNPGQDEYGGLKSYFQNVRTVDIDDIDVISVNAGTNWNDKYNFIEIKPQFQFYEIYAKWYKQKAQRSDANAFSREGFRPLIVDTKQFPAKVGHGAAESENDLIKAINYDALTSWTALMAEWYFNTHRLLNGTMTIIGQNTYIGVGDNIKINADLISPTPNLTSSSVNNQTNNYLLAHVENVQHSFTVKENGARQFITTIQFVRGILVEANGQPINGGLLDRYASSMSPADDKNTTNTVSTSDTSDPDPQKVRGT